MIPFSWAISVIPALTSETASPPFSKNVAKIIWSGRDQVST